MVEYTRKREAGGDSLASVARKLGPTQPTLWDWVHRTRELTSRPVEYHFTTLLPLRGGEGGECFVFLFVEYFLGHESTHKAINI